MTDSANSARTLVLLIRPAVLEHLDRSISLLSGDGPLEPTTTHEIRKAVKRIRAALQLVKSDLKSNFGEWNEQLRAVNHTLSAARDLEVSRQSVKDLLSVSSPSQRRVLERLQGELQQEQERIESETQAQSRPTLVANLQSMHAAFSAWQPAHTGFGLIRPAVRRMAKDARRLIRRLRKDPAPDEFHALRKIVKRRLYWLEALQPLWPRGLKPEKKLVDSLAEQLGAHHDLEVVIEHLRDSDVSHDPNLSRAVAGVNRKLRVRQRKLESRALRAARRLFAERPKALSRRWAALVSIWEDIPPSVHPPAANVPSNGSPVKPRPR